MHVERSMVVPVDGSLRNRAVDFTMRIGEGLALSGRWRDTEQELGVYEHMHGCLSILVGQHSIVGPNGISVSSSTSNDLA